MCGDKLGVTMNIGEFDFRSPFEDLYDIESLLFKLRDLLTTALPDDLLDDESSSLSSSLSPDKNSSPEPWQDDDEQHEQRRHQEQFPDWVNNLERLRNNLQHGLHHQTSTPQVGVNLPPLKTPAAYQEYDYFPGAPNGNGFSVPTNGANIEIQRYENTDIATYDRGEVEGANSDDQEYNHQEVKDNNNLPHQKQRQSYYSDIEKDLHRKPSQDYYSDSVAYTTCTENTDYEEQQYGDVSGHENQNGGNYVPAQHQNGVTQNGIAQQGFAQNGASQQHYGPMGDIGHGSHAADGKEFLIDQNWTETQQLRQQSQQSRQANGIKENGQGHDGHDYNPRLSVPRQIQYRGDGAVDLQQNGSALHHHQQWGEMSNGNRVENGVEQKKFRINPIPENQVLQGNTNSGNAQQQFLQTVNNEQNRQTAQLEILYKAKSRELEQINRQLETLKDESAKEKRILNHQLAMITSEKDGVTANFEQSRELLVACKQEKTRLEEQYQAQGEQMKALTASQQELMEKLQTAQCTIENLAQQLQAVQMGDPHSKFSRDREDLLASIQEKNQEEVNMYRERLDEANRIADEKDTELKSLQEELRSLRKSLDQTRVEHAEVVNKLSKSLEESQGQCRQYLESGAVDEISQLKLELKQTSTARNMSQDMCNSLQEELQDLKEQVHMYESAASLGVMSNKVSPTQSESFGVRNLNKEDWETPKTSRTDTSNNGDMIEKLRQELNRAIANNRSKRTQVKQLQDNLKAAREKCEDHKEQVEELQFQKKDLQVHIKMLQSQSNGQLSGQRLSLGRRRSSCAEEGRRVSFGSIEARRNTSELESLKEDCKDLKMTIETKVKENADLKQHMMEMISEHDEDKQSTLDRVQNTCIQLHEDRSKQMRENLVSEWEAERDMLKEAHQHQLQEIRSELEAVQKELCNVKEDYLRVCEEKNQIEDDVTKKLNSDAENQLTKTTEELIAAKEKALEDLKLSLENEYRVKLMNAKADWQQEAKQQAETQLQIKLSDARVEWNATARKQATESVKQTLEAEWQTKLEAEVDSKLTEQLIQAKKDLELKHKEDKDEECRKIQTAWEEKHRSALEAALTKSESEWQEKLNLVIKQKVQEAIKECNQKWLAGDTNTRQLVKERVANERTKWLTETVDWEEVRMTWMDKEGTSLIEKEVTQARDELHQKYAEEIVKLENKYEHLDNERRKLMKEAADKLETEHKEFLKEHEETMMKAIQAAKTACEKDKVERMHQQSLEFEQNLAEKERHWETEEQGLLDRLEKVKGQHQRTQQQTEEELCNLRKQLRNSRDELQQTEHRLKQELKHMQGQLTSTNSATMEALEGRLTEMQRKHAAFVAKLKEQHEQERLEWNEGHGDHGDVEAVCQAVQTDAVEEDTSRNGLNELRSHYLSTVDKIRSDVLKYVSDMREQCRRTVHEEVKKERNATAKKLRQYYLRCLHQLMEEDKSSGSATLNKFIAMATALELPEGNLNAKDKSSVQTIPENISSTQGSRCSSRQSSRSTSPIEMITHHDPSQRRRDSGTSSTQSSRCSSRQSSRSSSPMEMITQQESSNRNKSAFKPITKPDQVTQTAYDNAATVHSNIRTHPNREISNQDEFHERNLYHPSEILEAETFRLSRQPREFNPSPERLQPVPQSPTTNRSSIRNKSVPSTITVRKPKVILTETESFSKQSNDSRKMENVHAKSNNLSNDSRVYNAGPITREQHPNSENQSSYLSLPTSNRDYEASYQRNVDGQKQIPRTDISAVSLATEYNELPESLDFGEESSVNLPISLNETSTAKIQERKESHESGQRSNVPYYSNRDRAQLSSSKSGFSESERLVTGSKSKINVPSGRYGRSKTVSVNASTLPSSSNRSDPRRQDNVMSRSQREKLRQDVSLTKSQRGDSRRDNITSRSSDEGRSYRDRSRQDISRSQRDKAGEDRDSLISQGDRSRRDDLSRTHRDISRQKYVPGAEKDKSREDNELLRSQRDRSRQDDLARSHRDVSRQDYVSRSHGDKSGEDNVLLRSRQDEDLSKSLRDTHRQDLSRFQRDKSGEDNVILRSQGIKSRQDKNLSRTSTDMSRQDVLSRSQSDRSRVSHLASNIPGASKRYKTAQYQDSGFDSPNIE